MALGEYTAAFTSRYGTYAMLGIALLIALGFVYAFNYTTLFGNMTAQ